MSENKKGMIEQTIKSALPIYIAAAMFLLVAIVLPIYKMWAILLAGALSAGAYFVADKVIKPRSIWVPAPATAYHTGEVSLDETLANAEQGLLKLSQLNDAIPDEALSASISRMEKAGKAILQKVAKEPEKAKDIRKFVSYYLPTSIKILTTYTELAAAGANGQNAQSLKQEVQQNADTIAKAFEAQLDALFAGQVLDVSADIVVLDGIAKSDGIVGQQMGQSKPNLQL